MPANQTPKQQLANRYRFGYKVKTRSDQNDELRAAIKSFLADHDINLPAYRQDFKQHFERVFHFDAATAERFGLMAQLYYALAGGKGYYALFEQGPEQKLVPMAFWYSRHRLDFVWNWRKSQIIRSRYRDFLETATDTEGRKLIEHYQPIHLVLTVPHRDGKFEGQRFYAKELIKLYHELRRSQAFKQYIYAGEYGVEIKRSQNHGLHIHIHSFILQRPEYSVNEVRAELVEAWKRLTKNSTDYSGLHYETLYTKEQQPNGSWKKNYIHPKTATTDQYLAGVMECIKYHFKPGCLEQTSGEFDILLIDEILTNTKGVRLYSRFGAFYKESKLNFNNLEKEPAEVVDEETGEVIEDITGGDAGKSEATLINPFTLEPAQTNQYCIAIGATRSIHHRTARAAIPYEPYLSYDTKLAIAPPELSLKEVIKYDARNQLQASVEGWAKV